MLSSVSVGLTVSVRPTHSFFFYPLQVLSQPAIPPAMAAVPPVTLTMATAAVAIMPVAMAVVAGMAVVADLAVVADMAPAPTAVATAAATVSPR